MGLPVLLGASKQVAAATYNVPGADQDLGSLPDSVLLDFNEQQFPLPKGVQAALDAPFDARIYPTRFPTVHKELRRAIAHQLGCVRPEDVLLTHGSDDALKLLVDVFLGKDDVVVTIEPGYAHTNTWLQLRGCDRRGVVVTDYTKGFLDLDLPTEMKCLYFSNPNNPLGQQLSLNQISALCLKYPGAMIIVDEAYADYRPVAESAANLLGKFPRQLFVTRTFSKLYGLAGVRLGYIVSPEAAAFEWAYNPKSVTYQALVAGVAALSVQPEYDRIVQEMSAERDKMATFLSKELHCSSVWNGSGPFVAFTLPREIDSTAFLDLLRERSVWLRNQGHNKATLSNGMRISISTARVMECVRAHMLAVVQELVQDVSTTDSE